MTSRTDTGLYFDAEAAAMDKRDRELIPRKLIVAVVSLALAALLIVTFAVLTDRPLAGQPEAAPILTDRTIIIEAEGKAVRVTDAATGEMVLDAKNGGFISVVVDGLERARLVAGIQTNEAVQLALYENGRVALIDPASKWQVELSSFGAGNVAPWIELLKK